jgi:hypothetical protein
MPTSSVQSSRLKLKRAFTAYYVVLLSPGIADPTEVFAACYDYVRSLLAELGPEEFRRRVDDETTCLIGQLDQDLRQKSRVSGREFDYADLEERLRECFEHGLARLDAPLSRMPVE